MNLCLAAECTATYSLSKYGDQQDNMERMSNHAASVHNNDIIDAEILTIVFCVFVATVFGADYFFLIFWPERRYPPWYNIARLVAALVVTLGVAAAALMSTIVVASHEVRITGVDAATAQHLAEYFYRPPLVYRHWAVNIAYVVLLWLGLVFTIASLIVMFLSVRHDGDHTTQQEQRSYEPKSSASA
ncbi:hypothetical protein FPV67DRAFT_1530121 [Lyophyllum atratum]|nr:hypothetical protein FPV67DRAFT_1530121 [Lyophyllum atratum]